MNRLRKLAFQIRTVMSHVTIFLSYLLFPISILLRIFKFRVLEHGPMIGNLGTQIDAYVKERKLHRVPHHRMIIYPHFAPFVSRCPYRLNSSNNYLFHLWKQHFFVVTNPLADIFLKPILSAPWLKYERPCFSDFPNQSYSAVSRAYYQQFPEFSRQHAILKIPEHDRMKGHQILRKMGIPENAWFVCFYAREPGYYGINDQDNQGVIRNVDVTTYTKALQEIIDRGGWCIRMGSSRMQPLPKSLRSMNRIIDYPKTSFVSDFMDVFLLATCRFMLTCSSGISTMPGIFGVPIVMTNTIPLHIAIPIYPKDITILKKYYSKSLRRFLSYREVFSSYVTSQTMVYFYDANHLQLIDNTEDEIFQATQEILDRLDNRYIEAEDYQSLQNHLHDMIPIYLFAHSGSGKVGYHFLKTNERLFL